MLDLVEGMAGILYLASLVTVLTLPEVLLIATGSTCKDSVNKFLTPFSLPGSIDKLKGHTFVDVCVNNRIIDYNNLTQSYIIISPNGMKWKRLHNDVLTYSGSLMSYKSGGKIFADDPTKNLSFTIYPIFYKNGVFVYYACFNELNEEPLDHFIYLTVREDQLCDSDIKKSINTATHFMNSILPHVNGEANKCVSGIL